MKTLWIVLLLIIAVPSCDIGGESRNAICRHKAVTAASVYGEYYPVRIVRGPTGNGEYHAMCQAYINGEWKFLGIPIQIIVDTVDKPEWFTITETYSLKDYQDKTWFSKGYCNSLE